MRKTRKAIVIGACLLGAAFVAFNVVAYNHAYAMTHFTAQGASSLIEESKVFPAHGASVLLVNFRGSGGSSESYTTIGVREADDVAAVVRYAQEHLRHSRSICFGQSMGAVAILRAVRLNGIAPDAVVLEAVFDTMLNTTRNRFASMRVPSFPSAQLLVLWGGCQWRFNGFRHNPVDFAAALRCPALFMHGADDPRATLAEGRRVFEAASGDKTFLTFQNTGHRAYLRNPERVSNGASAKVCFNTTPKSS